MDRRAFYCVADSQYFAGAVALLNSLRLVGQREPFIVLDCGLEPSQRALLQRAATVVAPRESRHPSLAKVDAPLQLPAAEVLALLDADMIAVRPLAQLMEDAARGNVVAFADDQPDRFDPEWAQQLGVDELHRHIYVNSGFLLLPGELAPILLERVAGLQDGLDLGRSCGFGERAIPKPFPDQDCWNAVLAAIVPAARMTVLDHALAPFQPREPVEIEDRRALSCRVADGRQPYLLHHIGYKPWLQDTPPSAYSRLLLRLLAGDDVSIRLAPVAATIRRRARLGAVRRLAIERPKAALASLRTLPGRQ